MNSRELALISTAAMLGAVASAIAIRFFPNPNKKPSFHCLQSSSSTLNGIVEKPPKQCPFDPSKRKGLARELTLLSLTQCGSKLTQLYFQLGNGLRICIYLSWDDYFMAIAFLSAERSKDPNRQVGACLVNQNGIILGIGYNGFPRGCADDKLPWAKKSRTGNPLETKYPYVCHAEVNAILNKNHASAAGQKLYVTMFPCNECAKIIIQQGVSEVIYFVEKNISNSDTSYMASHRLLSMAGIKVRKHRPQMDQILLKFEET